MEYITLGKDLRISRVLTGLWQIADMERDGKELSPDTAARAMEPYASAGLTTFDMADHYGSAEIIAGRFKNSHPHPETIQLLTKWVPEPGKITKAVVREAVDRALSRMQARQIGLMQFHAWNYADPNWLDGLFWLQELQTEGLIREIGLTNFDTVHLEMALASGIPIVSNQVCYSLLDQRAAGEMTKVCQKYGVKILAFGTIAGGFLTEKWLGRSEPAIADLETWSQMKYKRFIDVAGGWEPYQHLLQTLAAVATDTGHSIANIASKYMLEQPAVGGVIIGARLGKSQHVAENVQLLSFQLPSEARERIQSALQQLQPIPGDCGDEYRKPPFLTASGDLSHHLESIPPPYSTTVAPDGTERVFTGTVWEPLAGYCRAIKQGNQIRVSGTTATHINRVIGAGDAGVQTHFILDKIEGTLQSLGASLNDVVRTRIFIKNTNDWETVSRAHGNRFSGIFPANTLVRADLIGDEYLVEIEAEALIR